MQAFASVHLANVLKRWFEEVNVVSPGAPLRDGPRLLVSVEVERISLSDGRIPSFRDAPGQAIVSMDWAVKIRRPGAAQPVFEFSDKIGGQAFREGDLGMHKSVNGAVCKHL